MWRRYLRFIRPPIARDVDEELRFHFQSRIEELIAGGATPGEAERRASEEFGDFTQVRSDLMSIDRRAAERRSRREYIRETWSDVRYALRSLRRTPGLAAGVILLLALGIGANAAMFTFLDAVFLRMPDGVANPAGIRRLWTSRRFSDGAQYWSGFSYSQFDAVRAIVGDRATVSVYVSPSKTKIGRGESGAEAQLSMASAGFMNLVGARAEVGRLYDANEDRLDGAARVAVVSHRYWMRELSGDRGVIGKPIVIAGARYTVVGVVRDPFVGVDLDAVDVWIPLAFHAEGRGGKEPWWKSPNVNGFQILLRPAAGANETLLEQQVTTALRRPAYGWYSDTLTIARFGSIVSAAGPGKRAQEVQIGIRLAGVALIVLLIACANVVNLLLGRAVQRQREIAVRLALGITRWRLIRLLFAETLVLGLAAGAAALLVGYVAGASLRRLLLPDVHWASSPVDGRVIWFALGVALVAAVVAGLVPALQSAATDVTNVLKSRGGGARGSRMRSALVMSQAALSALLLCGAGLFVRSLSNVRRLDLGFDTQRVITATVSYDDRSRSSDPAFPSRLSDLETRIAALPGVSHVALSSARPMYSISWLTFFTETDSSRRDFDPTWTAVSAGYFDASGVRLLRGRDFPASSIGDHSVIVNEAMARTAWPGRSALGQCMRFGKRSEPCYGVIGIVENSREHRVIEEAKPMYYLPLNDLPPEAKAWKADCVVLNAEPAAAVSVVASIRALIRQEFPGGIPSIVRLNDYLEPQYRPWQLGATLFSVFGVLALVVAVIGIYSTTSYGVEQRVHEFGIRIALGARMADVMRLVLVGGMRVVATGVLLGIALAIAAGRLIASLLYGVTPTDPATALGVTVCLVLAGIAAAVLPAWRAASVDPAATLKSD
jgi:putative ABC transport system permease protein